MPILRQVAGYFPRDLIMRSRTRWSSYAADLCCLCLNTISLDVKLKKSVSKLASKSLLSHVLLQLISESTRSVLFFGDLTRVIDQSRNLTKFEPKAILVNYTPNEWQWKFRNQQMRNYHNPSPFHLATMNSEIAKKKISSTTTTLWLKFCLRAYSYL